MLRLRLCTANTATQCRSIVIPKQLKAFGGTFSDSGKGERSANMIGLPVLQNLSARSQAVSHRRTAMVDDFTEMSLDASVRTAFTEEFAIASPSPIQQLAMPVGAERNVAVVVAAPSGSGKTLACLAPAYSNMVKDRDVYKIPTREFRPRMIVLAPTREVLRQTQGLCKKLDAHTGLRSVVMTRTTLMKRKMKKLLREGKNIDVLVMHPHMVLKLIRHRRLFIDDLRYVMVDEADEMLAPGQDAYTQQLLAKVRKRILYKHLPSVETQIYFNTSNVTREVTGYVKKNFPNAVHCFAPNTHLAPENIKFRFYPVPKESAKLEMLEFLLNRKTLNYPQNRDHSGVDSNVDSRPLTAASVATPVSSSSLQLEADAEEEDSMTYKQWLAKRKKEVAKGTATAASGKEVGKQSEPISSFPSPGLSVANPDVFVPSNDSPYPVNQSISKRDRDVRDKLRSEVSKALSIPTSRKYGSAGLIRPSVRWQNVLTHASPFQFYIPQTFVPQSGLRVMIFMRQIDTCAAIYYKLKEQGYNVAMLHGSLPEDVRGQMLRRFASGQCNIMCCTNILSRGVDIPVDVVINFDLPRNAIDFLNRAGRCGRMGRPGTCYSLVHQKRDTIIAGALNLLIKKGLALNDVSNDAKHMTQPRHSEWATHHKNKLARAYVSMISKAVIPKSLTKTYIKHNAMWRPLFNPSSTHHNAGIAPRQQDKIMAGVMRNAVWFRRLQLAKRKGGRAKFGRTGGYSPWSWKGPSHGSVVANGNNSEEVANSMAPR